MTRTASDSLNDVSYSGTKTIVLGATGFIGRWVARALSDRGADTYLVVRDASRAHKLFAEYGVRGNVVELDLCDFGSVSGFIREVRPTITFNAAGYGVDPGERDDERAACINAGLVAVICDTLGHVRDQGWPGLDLVHVGSAAEYGAAGANLAEDCRPRPTGTYGRTKLVGTHCVTRHALAGRLKGMTARLFTVYGPGEHDGRLLSSLLKAADTDAPLRLTKGAQARDFTYVADVAQGLLRLGLLSSVRETVVNLATGRLTRVRDFAEIAARVLDVDSELLAFGALPARADEMVHGPVTIERLWRLTGWVPLTAVADGIRRTADAVGRRPRRRVVDDVTISSVPGRVVVPVCGR